MILDATLLNTQHYKVRIKRNVSNPGYWEAPSPTPQWSSYQNRSLQDTLDYGRQIYLYIYMR